MAELVLFPNNTMQVELRGLKNKVTGLYQINATVNITSIKDAADDSTVSGITFPIALNYVPQSRGVYRGRVSSGAAIVDQHTYTLTITASDAAGSSARWSIDVPARVRDN